MIHTLPPWFNDAEENDNMTEFEQIFQVLTAIVDPDVAIEFYKKFKQQKEEGEVSWVGIGGLRISLVYIHSILVVIIFDWTALKSMDYIDFTDIDGIIEQNLSWENLYYFTLYWL